MDRPVLMGIHGVGHAIPGAVSQMLKSLLIDIEVDIDEYNWSRRVEHPLDPSTSRVKYKAIRTVAGELITAAAVGPSPGGRLGDRVFSAMHVSAALGIAVWFLMPLLGFAVRIATSAKGDVDPGWYPWYQVFLRAMFGWSLACAAGVVVLGAGAGVAARRWGPLWIAIRRVGLLLAMPFVVMALLPLVIPWSEIFPLGSMLREWRSSAVAIGIGIGVAVFLAVLQGQVTSTFQAVSVSAYILPLMAMYWILAWVSRCIAGPTLKILLDIFRYVGSPAYRADILEGLDDRVSANRPGGGRPVVLAAHSLGSVIAVDSLVNSPGWGPDDDVLLITMGSPIGRFFFRFFPGALFPGDPRSVADAIAARVRSFTWVNVYRPLDPIGAGLGLAGAGCGVDRSTGQYRRLNAHGFYFSDPAVLESVMKAREGVVPVARASGPVPTRLLAVTRPPYLTAVGNAFGWAFAIAASIVAIATAIGSALTIADSRRQVDEIVKKLEDGGERASADVTHRSIMKDPGGDHRPPIIDQHFRFRFRTRTGRQVDKEWVLASGDSFTPAGAFGDGGALFDGDKLMKDIHEAGHPTVEGNSLYLSTYYAPHERKDLTLIYLPSDPEWFRLPGYPPYRKTRIALMWATAPLMILMVALFGVLVVVVGFWWFDLFLGGVVNEENAPSRSPKPA